MSPNIAWRIETAMSDDILVDALLDEIPEYRRGETRSFTLSFRTERYTYPSGGFRYGNEVWGNAVYDEGSGSGSLNRYTAARQYLDYAGSVATGTDVDNVPWYREQQPPRATVDSPLVALVPSPELRATAEIQGVWGVIVDGADESLPALSSFELTFEVFVLAEYADYADRAAVETEFHV
jgi:hypothetical protein